MKKIFLITLSLLAFSLVFSQSETNYEKQYKELEKVNTTLKHRLDRLEKMVDDVLWFQRLGDFAHIDKLYIYGPPVANVKNPTAMGAQNPLKFWTYLFLPKDIDSSKKYPLIVFPHGGVHGDFTTYYTHIVKELIGQGYVVVAPEYRGSTGYGKKHYEYIDYGGRENDDVYACRNFVLNNYDFVDKNRVGIIGWSHGGMISLMNIFNYPKAYQVAYAGVPVSDLIARMGYYTQEYRDLYEVDYHIGKSAYDNVEEYRKRSPAWNTHKYKGTPLLIYTNTNDDDVNVLEVEHLIKSLKVEGKPFDYKIFKDMPGGHSYDRIDTKVAKEIRVKIYKHLNKRLKPSNPIKTLKDLHKIAYEF